MFVSKSKMALRGLFIGMAMTACVGATTLAADGAPERMIPVTVTLDGITQTTGPIYVSIQTREQYMGMKGQGGIIKTVKSGAMTQTFKISEPGDYSISVWHDLDDDGRFSMDENYKVLDGYGASGHAPDNSRPTFDDVKVTVPSYGTDVRVAMKYPS